MKNEAIRTKRSRALPLLSVLLFGLSANAPVQAESGNGLQVTEGVSRFGTAVWLTEACPSQTRVESAPLLAPLVAIGAEFIMGRVSSALKARTEGLTGQFIARGGSLTGLQIEASSTSIQAGCLIVGRGLMGSGTYRGRLKGTQAGGLEAAHLNALGFVDYPAFYVEFGMERATHGEATSLVLKPMFVSYAATSAPKAGSKQKDVAVVIALSSDVLNDKTAIDGDKPFAVFRHDLGKLQIGKYYKASALAGTSAAQSLPGKNLQASVNIAALVTESEDPSVTTQALTTAFDSHKSDLQEAVEKALGKLVGLSDEAPKSGTGATE